MNYASYIDIYMYTHIYIDRYIIYVYIYIWCCFAS